jgi:dethiobiotin synthetase
VSALVVVAGTGTEVGKTYVTAAVTRVLRARGVSVATRKPVQSFAPGDSTTDADVLAAASGEHPDEICPPHRRYAIPMAPPMAADALGLPAFTITDLVSELRRPEGATVLVESAGGVRSPLASNGDTIDLVDALRPALVVLVADAGLGTINAVRLSMAALDAQKVVVYVNRFDETDDLHRRNAQWLRSQTACDVVTDIAVLAERITALS